MARKITWRENAAGIAMLRRYQGWLGRTVIAQGTTTRTVVVAVALRRNSHLEPVVMVRAVHEDAPADFDLERVGWTPAGAYRLVPEADEPQVPEFGSVEEADNWLEAERQRKAMPTAPKLQAGPDGLTFYVDGEHVGGISLPAPIDGVWKPSPWPDEAEIRRFVADQAAKATYYIECANQQLGVPPETGSGT